MSTNIHGKCKKEKDTSNTLYQVQLYERNVKEK